MIERTGHGLTETLFQELDKLVSGKSTPQQARATSRVASTIVSVARLQLDFARFVADSRTDGGALPELSMGKLAKSERDNVKQSKKAKAISANSPGII